MGQCAAEVSIDRSIDGNSKRNMLLIDLICIAGRFGTPTMHMLMLM